jgi:pimeloyl-ACP methyl ester carboxylesterase
MTRPWRALVLLLALPLLPGPARAGSDSPTPGVVFVAGGVGGMGGLDLSVRLALGLAGVKHEVRHCYWSTGLGRMIRDVQDTDNAREHAARLADEVRRCKEACPDRAVYLVGHSGGTGIVLAAAALLPPATVERIILLSPAVSPGYDLRPALRATRAEIVSFHSPLDRFWLDWGTSRFGTMIDRIHAPAAGVLGFDRPQGDAKDAALYSRLVQIGWRPEMLLEQRGGLHVSTVLPLFLVRHVVPWLVP